MGGQYIFWISLILIIYTHGGYFLLLIVLSKIKTKKRKYDENYTPTVSMVIAAYNEEKIIAEKIQNCLALDYPKTKIEFIIGSDGSTDKTEEIIGKCTDKNVKLHSFKQRAGKANVLNTIVPEAKGEILIFSDANTIYDSDSIKKMVPYFVDPSVGGVCGKLVLSSLNESIGSKGETLYWRYENLLKYLEGKVKTVFGANGAIYAIRKELFRKLPSIKTIMDDFLIPLKVVELGYDVIYESMAIGREFATPNIQGEFLRKVRIGAANFHALREIIPLLNPFKGYIAFGLWSHKIARWFVPFFLIALLISNIFIAQTFFYSGFLVIQILFYFMALCGWAFTKKGIKMSLLFFVYYFVVVNFALLVGFFKFLTRTQKPTWTRVER